MSRYLVWTKPDERWHLGRVVRARCANEAARIAAGGPVRLYATIHASHEVDSPAGTRLYMPVEPKPVVCVLAIGEASTEAAA